MLRLVSGRTPLAALSLARRATFGSAQSLPKFEIHDVRDDPELGTMTRVAVDGKLLLVSQYPQLGPRKVDPNDLSPQFDSDRRISVRMRHIDLAYLVSVCTGRVLNHRMENRAYSLNFEKTAEGYCLHGKVHRVASQKMEDWSVNFDKHFALTLEHFLESALTESFGFRQHYIARTTESAAAAIGGADEVQRRKPQTGGAPQKRRQGEREKKMK